MCRSSWPTCYTIPGGSDGARADSSAGRRASRSDLTAGCRISEPEDDLAAIVAPINWGSDMMTILRASSLVVTLCLAGGDSASAQSVSSGTIEGTVRDESNLILPGATVILS